MFLGRQYSSQSNQQPRLPSSLHQSTHLRYNTPRPYGRTLPNPHTRQNYHIPPNPAVLLDPHFLAALWTLRTLSDVRVKRMSCRIDRNIGTKQRASTNGHKAGVGDGAVEVDEEIFLPSTLALRPSATSQRNVPAQRPTPVANVLMCESTVHVSLVFFTFS